MIRHSRIVRAAALLMGALVAACPTGSAQDTGRTDLAAGEIEAECRLTPDVWIASTRRLPGVCHGPAPADLSVERLVGGAACRFWEPADLGALLAAPDRPLVVFIHGNRYDSADAKSQGIRLAQRLAACCPGGPPPRVIVFSWPSEKQGMLLKDGRRKYERAYADGHYLAGFLEQIEPEQPVGIVGYSFGALVAAEALENLTTKNTLSHSRLGWADRPGRTHLVLVAPAIRSDAVAPRGPFRSMLAGLDRFTLLINSRDEALRFFPMLEPHVRADALGFVGLPRRWLPVELEYSATDAAAVVGKMHTMRRYLDSATLSSRIANGLLDGLTED
jgi:esterase/lipase superfamily enzyme